MEPIQAVSLGILQGLTEFLPVSSSGHLVLLQNAFGIKEPELLFDISVHMGTLVAVCIVFFTEIKNILVSLIRLPSLLRSSQSLKNLFNENADIRLAGLIVLGTIPTAVLGLIFHEMVDQLFAGVGMVGIMLLITGTLLWITRKIPLTGRSIKEMTLKDAIGIGVVQGLAIIPGISRSGSTISVALFLKIDRETAGRYSFLLSIPAMVGALILALGSDSIHNSLPPGIILLASATAAIVGYAALKILLRLVKKGRLYLFAPYCWIAGCAVLIFTV
ncbi:MAG TPA: undecaprenyl-diphosphate phosphatase [Deltaproteobacteria bacterium]|nr:undecaprenyl-diphosphate phosphatase [Deltaproteobacteria bacterium]